MSVTTEVTIQTDYGNAMGKINAWLLEHDTRRPQFVRFSMEQGGGTSGPHTDVWNACFNYMNWDLLDVLQDPDTWGIHKACWSIESEDGLLVGMCRLGQVLTVEHRSEWLKDVARFKKNGESVITVDA